MAERAERDPRDDDQKGMAAMTFYKFAVGVVLALAMIAVLGLSALVFSSRDFQFGVAQIAPTTNGLVDINHLVEVDAQIQQLEAESSAPRGELIEIEQGIAAIDNAVTSAEAEANQARSEIVGQIAEIETRANVNAPSAAADLNTGALNTRIQSLAGRPGLSAADQQAVASLNTQVRQLATTEEGLDSQSADRSALVARQRLIGGQVAESNRRIFALQQSVVPEYEHYGRIRGEAFALRTLSPLGVSAFFAQGHPALLSTMLVLLMGALGALLYLFPAYLNRAVPVTMAEIVVRLIFGMCAALAFYVLANATIAGFSIASSVQQAGTSGTLNPFTVSLIGIVAGVLAEDIAKWIQDRGRGIFQQGGAAASPVAAPPPTSEDVGFSGVNPHGGPNAP